MKGMIIYRRDMTREMTAKEKELAKKYGIDEFRIPTPFRCRLSIGVPPSHRMIENNI